MPDDPARQLREDGERIHKLRTELLFDRDVYEQLENGPAALHFIQASSFLELASTSLKLAAERLSNA